MPQDHEKIKYFLYARKSSESEDRQVQSIDDQVNRLKKLAENFDLKIVKVYTEARTAKTPEDRPVFKEMLDQIDLGKANGILCWQINRLSRNPVDSAKIQWMLQQKTIQSIQTIDKQYLPEDNVLLLTIESGVANQFIIDLSKNTKRGMQSKVEKGWLPHIAPLGYLNDQINKTIIKDPERFDLVRRMFDLMLTGNYTARRIVRMANKEWGFRTRMMKRRGNRPLSESGMYRILINKFYAGIIESNDEEYQGKHEPMITLSEYNRVRSIMKHTNRPRPKTREFAFTAMMKCGECGCSITAEEKHQTICTNCKNKFSCVNQQKCPTCHTEIAEMTNPKRLMYIHYHCTKKKEIKCNQGGIQLSVLENQIKEFLGSIQINQKYLDLAIKHLQIAHEKDTTSRESILLSRQKAYNEASKKVDKLLEMRLAEEITEDEYKAKKQAVLAEKEHFKELLEYEDRGQNKTLEQAEKVFSFAKHARDEFENGSLQRKREILATLGSNLTLKDGILNIQAYEPFAILKKGLAKVPEARERLEPSKKPVYTGSNALIGSRHYIWGG